MVSKDDRSGSIALKNNCVNSDGFSRSICVMRMCALSGNMNPARVEVTHFSSVDAEGSLRNV